MRDDTTKNRIARYFEIRYKTINARKNWEKLSNLYDLYNKKISFEYYNSYLIY